MTAIVFTAFALLALGSIATFAGCTTSYVRPPATAANLTEFIRAYGLLQQSGGECFLEVQFKSGRRVRQELAEAVCRDAAQHIVTQPKPAPAK